MLENKDIATLKQIANSGKINKYIVGKSGIDDNVIKLLENALYKNELIKISILNTCSIPMIEIELTLIDILKCEIICKIGRSIVIYKKSKNNKIKHLI